MTAFGTLCKFFLICLVIFTCVIFYGMTQGLNTVTKVVPMGVDTLKFVPHCINRLYFR